MRLKSSPAFTLAELLIALAILGVIATFAIPKILQSQQDSRKKAIMRENIATVQQIVYAMIQQGEMTTGKVNCGPSPATIDYDKFFGRLNHTRRVGNMAYLANGSAIWVSTGHAVDFYIDYNGDVGPDQPGVDGIQLYYNQSATQCYDIPPNRFGTNWNNGLGADQAANDAFYGWIFES